MKEAGVTSVIFNGDPIAPREFTNEATAQNYFPEWIVTGSVLVDTAAFSRTYDQQQWANAFGVSNLSARVDRSIGSSYAIYEWFQGEPPPAPDNIPVITPVPNTFYAFLQATGPNLTIETFNEGAFSGEPTRRAVTGVSLSWGTQGIWPDEFRTRLPGHRRRHRDLVGCRCDRARRDRPGRQWSVALRRRRCALQARRDP